MTKRKSFLEEENSMVDNAKDVLGRKRVIGLRNAESTVGINPKDKIGAAKVDLTLIPGTGQVHEALALMDGATKYGPYNWRKEPIQLRTYIAAAKRHLEDFLDGEEFAPDSGIHHLGHVKACCSIMLDAMEVGTYVDDRPIEGVTYRVIERANEFIKTKPPGWGR